MSVEAEIRAAEEQLRLGDASPEPDTSQVFDGLLAEDVLFVQPGATTVGKTAVLKGHRPPRKRMFRAVEVTDVTIRELSPEAALVACVTTYSLADRKFAMRTLRAWGKRDGRWTVAAVAMMPESTEAD